MQETDKKLSLLLSALACGVMVLAPLDIKPEDASLNAALSFSNAAGAPLWKVGLADNGNFLITQVLSGEGVTDFFRESGPLAPPPRLAWMEKAIS